MLINQGSYDDGIIIADDVVAKIKDIRVLSEEESLLEISFLILLGEHKGKIVVDKISCNPSHKLGWKYPILRRALNMPIKLGTQELIDTEDFENKKILLKLSAYDTYSRNGTPYKLQKINYKEDYKHILDNFIDSAVTKEKNELESSEDVNYSNPF